MTTMVISSPPPLPSGDIISPSPLRIGSELNTIDDKRTQIEIPSSPPPLPSSLSSSISGSVPEGWEMGGGGMQDEDENENENEGNGETALSLETSLNNIKQSFEPLEVLHQHLSQILELTQQINAKAQEYNQHPAKLARLETQRNDQQMLLAEVQQRLEQNGQELLMIERELNKLTEMEQAQQFFAVAGQTESVAPELTDKSSVVVPTNNTGLDLVNQEEKPKPELLGKVKADISGKIVVNPNSNPNPNKTGLGYGHMGQNSQPQPQRKNSQGQGYYNSQVRNR